MNSPNFVKRDELNEISQKIERTISSAIENFIGTNHRHVFMLNSDFISRNQFNVDNLEIVLTIDAKDNMFEKVLKVNFIPLVRRSNAPELITSSKLITQKGRFNRVEICYPNKILELDEDFIFTLSTSYVNIGYDWLNEALIKKIKEITGNINVEIYDFFRKMVQDKPILEGFIFSVVAKDRSKKNKDFVLLDETSVSSLIKLANNSNLISGGSSASLVSDMIFEVVPVEESVICDVVAAKTKKDIDLAETNKWNSNNLSRTLRVVWGDVVCCYPIITEGNFLLVAFYPKRNDADIDSFLELHKEALSKIAKKNISIIYKTIAMLEKINGREAVLFGSELLGRFFASLIESQIKS
ncbi:MAG: hypothetical protein FE834_06680 [Gammaproteobacteria bacterium]|nr:hypothetical protein [Gammaproteobacteria bacterium]